MISEDKVGVLFSHFLQCFLGYMAIRVGFN